MKDSLIIIGIFLCFQVSAQTLSVQEKQEILQQLKKEILDSLKKEALVSIDSNEMETSKINKQKGEPLEGIDQTWQNGSDRRDSSVFKNMQYFTPSVFVDVNYTYSFNNPTLAYMFLPRHK